MAHERYTRTNQKLYFAQLSLGDWRQADESPAADAQARREAARENSVFHLYGALLGLCHEVAGFYGLEGKDSTCVEAFLAPTVKERAPGPELSELMELAEHRETWLAKLLECHAALHRPPKPPVRAKVDPRAALIDAVAVDAAATEASSADDMAAWLQNLRQLAVRFRESLTEI